ncbi:glycosyltransferase [Halegenticoccus tardaugens]|uniref:glycosyltransferase n=1 Tax=Halegenticoccus tardaugens TaxID=2071624 RepID=UPI00100A2BED|nr:glycosyltransferase family 2 protein [Halegenticoccus tardaugens]
MEVRTPSEARSDVSVAAGTAAVAALLCGALVVPALLIPAYAGLLAASVLAASTGIAFRMILSTLLSVGDPAPEPPSLPADPPTVSVVVTAYNEADALEGTVASCLRQSYPTDRLEVVVGYEAASDDGTADVAERIAARNRRVAAVRREVSPGGKAAAVNHALPRAEGDVIASVDAGQRFEPTAVRRAVRRLLEGDDVWCVKGRCFGTNAAASLVALHATVERHLIERTEFVARDVAGGFTLFTGGQAFFRREALSALGGFDETVLLEDLDAASRIHARGKRIRVDPTVVSAERNPETLAAWWSQRKRWVRGGMQVARRHLRRLSDDPNLSPIVRLDALYTFCVVLTLPILLLASPVATLSALGVGPPFPGAALSTAAAAVSSTFALPYAVFLQDELAGRAHDPREYVAPLTLPAYLALQAAVVVAAFVDEFVRRRPAVYVTSSEASSRGGAGERSDEDRE